MMRATDPHLTPVPTLGTDKETLKYTMTQSGGINDLC